MKKKIVKLMLSAVMITSLLVGCGNTETSSEESSAQTSEKNSDAQKITLTCWYDEDDMAPILEQVNKKLAGEYTIEYTYVAQTDYNNVLSTQLAAGEGPDIVADGTNFPARIKAGNVKDISSSDYLTGFNDAGFALCKDGDKTYGIPSYGWFSGLWYNKDIFTGNGITELPKTFDELVATCDKLSENDVQPLGFGLADGDTAIHSLLGYLENDFYETSEEGKNFDEEFAKGSEKMSGTVDSYVENWHTLIDKGYINDTMVGISNEQALNDFIAGKTAMFNGGPWQYTNFLDAGMNFGMLPHMGNDGNVSFLIGGPAVNFGINVNTKNEEGAEKAMEALASVEVQQAFVDANVGGFSYRDGVQVDVPGEYDEVKDILEAGDVACSWDRWSVNMPSQSLLDEAISQMQGMVTGDISVEEFLKALDQKADSIRY